MSFCQMSGNPKLDWNLSAYIWFRFKKMLWLDSAYEILKERKETLQK